MQTYGLIGMPLGHSFSARYFAEKFEREGIEAQYLNFEMANPAVDVPALLAQHDDLRGFNVTIPHKQAVIPLLSEMSEEARAIGAVNVVSVCRRPDGEVVLKGYNSDVIGFTASIRPLLKPCHKKALVLGTGGASLAVVYGLCALGVEPVYVSRTAAPGRLTYDDLTPEVMADHLVVVNCSPVGMYPRVEAAPAIPYETLTADHLLYDLVYNPLTTAFMRRGAERGATVKNGLEMLHLQAEAAWDFWQKDLK